MTTDPASHRDGPIRWFEDFSLGERYHVPSRTMTEGVFAAFQTASGDNHPIHYDRHYCQQAGHRDMLAHGFQTLIQCCIGATPLAHQMGPALIGFLEQSAKFTHFVYLGDTLYPVFEITGLEPRNTTGTLTCSVTVTNQDGLVVLEGTQTYLMRRRPA